MTAKVSIADARKNFDDIVNKVASYGNESVILTHRGKDVAVLISIDELELLHQIQDRMDIEDARRALVESGDNISAEEVWNQLGV